MIVVDSESSCLWSNTYSLKFWFVRIVMRLLLVTPDVRAWCKQTYFCSFIIISSICQWILWRQSAVVHDPIIVIDCVHFQITHDSMQASTKIVISTVSGCYRVARYVVWNSSSQHDQRRKFRCRIPGQSVVKCKGMCPLKDNSSPGEVLPVALSTFSTHQKYRLAWTQSLPDPCPIDPALQVIQV